MIKLENFEVMGWEHVIRGMRNPMNSWGKSDSAFHEEATTSTMEDGKIKKMFVQFDALDIGPEDHKLMMKLRNAGTDHRKYMRMIAVYVDITAPLYWWKEFDTYKVGTVANSCSTMHKIGEKRFEMSDFSTEHLLPASFKCLGFTVKTLNECRDLYLGYDGFKEQYGEHEEKGYWWQMIQLLPSSYNQKRTVMLNYEVLANIYRSRKNHKLDEWVEFCAWIEKLPYSEIITGNIEIMTPNETRALIGGEDKND